MHIYDVSVSLSVKEVHWCIIANLGFKFRSQFTAVRSQRMRARGKGSSLGRVEGSSHAMLATARPSCLIVYTFESLAIFTFITSFRSK